LSLYKGEYLADFEALWAAEKRMRYHVIYEKAKNYKAVPILIISDKTARSDLSEQVYSSRLKPTILNSSLSRANRFNKTCDFNPSGEGTITYGNW